MAARLIKFCPSKIGSGLALAVGPGNHPCTSVRELHADIECVFYTAVWSKLQQRPHRLARSICVKPAFTRPDIIVRSEGTCSPQSQLEEKLRCRVGAKPGDAEARCGLGVLWLYVPNPALSWVPWLVPVNTASGVIAGVNTA